MLRHAWPGNVRELQNRVMRAVILAPGRHPDPGRPGPRGRAAGGHARQVRPAAETPAAGRAAGDGGLARRCARRCAEQVAQALAGPAARCRRSGAGWPTTWCSRRARARPEAWPPTPRPCWACPSPPSAGGSRPSQSPGGRRLVAPADVLAGRPRAAWPDVLRTDGASGRNLLKQVLQVLLHEEVAGRRRRDAARRGRAPRRHPADVPPPPRGRGRRPRATDPGPS